MPDDKHGGGGQAAPDRDDRDDVGLGTVPAAGADRAHEAEPGGARATDATGDDGEAGGVELVDGFKCLAAAEALGWPSVSIVVRPLDAMGQWAAMLLLNGGPVLQRRPPLIHPAALS